MSTTLTLHHDPPRFLRFLFYFFLLTLTQFPPPATAQLPNTLSPPPPQEDRFSRLKFDKSMAIVLVILVAVFFVLGFLSVYTRQCAERRMRGRFDLSISISIPRRQRGLDRDIIETFPTFVYSTVKSRKIGLATLECAVCLNEFEEDETLRLIPKCSHVFHPDCIDAWLANHSTCPVCRANLVPKPDDPSFLPIQFPDPEQQPVLNTLTRPETDDSQKVNDDLISETENRMLPLRSRSTGHSLVQPGENCERFTLHLPEEVRNQLMLSRTKSCGVNVTFTRENSERRGYRTRSVGSTAPHVTGWFSRTRSVKDDVGERSSDRLFSTTTTRDSEV